MSERLQGHRTKLYANKKTCDGRCSNRRKQPVFSRFSRTVVFRCRLNMGSDVDAVTKSGRLFHTRAAATGKARSPTVDSRDGGTTRAGVDAERRRHAVCRGRRHAGSRWWGTVAQCHGDSGKREQLSNCHQCELQLKAFFVVLLTKTNNRHRPIISRCRLSNGR